MIEQPIFSAEDSDLASLRWCPDTSGYARRTWPDGTSHPKQKWAHRIVMERKTGRPLTRSDIADHINRVRLDCRRENLRLTDLHGNAQNVMKGLFRGTGWHKKGKKWQATVKHRGKTFYAGLFAKREDAAEAARKKREDLGFLSSHA